MKDYESIYKGERRIRKVLSIGFLITADTVEWTGKWFKYVWIHEKLYKERYLKFDDGWNYQYYWSSWRDVWRFENIV